MDEVHGLWVYEKPGRESVLWSLHKTEDGAKKALKLIETAFAKTGFIGRLPVRD